MENQEHPEIQENSELIIHGNAPEEVKEELAEQLNAKRESMIFDLIKVFPAYAHVELVHMMSDLRPVAEICVIPEFKDEMLPAIEELKKQGFAVASKERNAGIIDFFVSKDKKCADEAAAVNSIENPKRFGELMGFPNTAIEAYMAGHDATMPPKEVEAITGFKNYCFPFAMSKQHHKEEIEYLRRSYAVVLEKAPDAINRMLPTSEDPEEYRKKVAAFVHGS